jgi:hypothetical protein
MRWSIAVALGLFATNVVVLNLRDEPQPVPQAALMGTVSRGVFTTRHPPSELHATETQRLAWLHTAWRSGFRPRGCAHHDPLAILDADVDPSPGHEHVIGNRQHGVAMYAKDGMLLAYMHPVGCGQAAQGDQSLSLSFNTRLIVTVRDVRSDAQIYTAFIAERQGDLLVERLSLPVGHTSADREVEAKLYFSGQSVEAKAHGRMRVDGEWRAVDEHCTSDLVTRSSSCRRPAEEQTSARE